uniref:basic helix-loop-helix domain-containing protein USF3-like n=1 Tax=Myxine glutinosa TaxID=7769 RepID=UPI00358F203F
MPEAIVLGCSDMSKAHSNKNRESHNAVERHRKLKINSGISKIAELLPCSSALKQSKNMILEQAVIHIVELNKRCEDLLTNGGTKAQADEIARLRSKISWLRGENVRLCSLLKAHSISSHPDPSLHWRVKSRQRKNSNNDATRLARGGSGRTRGNAKSRLIASSKNGTSVASTTGDKINVEFISPGALEFVESEREDSQGQTRIQEKVETKDGKRQDGETNKKEKRTNGKPGKCRLTVTRKAEPVKPRLETPPDPGICSSHSSSISSLRPTGLSGGAGTRTMTTWATLQVGQGFCPQVSIPCSTQTIISDVAALLKVTGSCEVLDDSLTRESSKTTTPATSSNFIIVQSPRARLSPPQPLVILHPAQPFTSLKGSSTSRHHFPSILPRPSNDPGVDCTPVGETGPTEQTIVLDEHIFNVQPLNDGNEIRGTRAFGSLQSIQPDPRPTEPVCHVGVGGANNSGVLQIIQPNFNSLETMANVSLSAVGALTGLNKGAGAPFIKTMHGHGQKTNLSLAKTTDSSLKFVVSQGKLPSINQKSATVHTLLGQYRASTTLSVTNKRANGRGERQRARAKRVTQRAKPQKSGTMCTLSKTVNEQVLNSSIPPVSTDGKHCSTLGLPALVPPSPPGHTSISTVSAVSSPSPSETVAATESIVQLNAVVEADDVVTTEVDTVCITINKDGPSINIVADQDGSTWVSEDNAVQFENRNKDVSIISKDASLEMVENVVSDNTAPDMLDKVGASSKPSQNTTAVVSQIGETLLPESVNVESGNLSASKYLNSQTPVTVVLEKCTTWPATLNNSNAAEKNGVSSSQSIISSDIEFSKCITASENDNAQHAPSLPTEGLVATQTPHPLDNFAKDNMLSNRDMAIDNFVSNTCSVMEQSTTGGSRNATKTGQKVVNTHSGSPSASVFVSEITVTSADMASKSLRKCNTDTSRITVTKECKLANATASSSLITPINCATSVKNPNNATTGVHDENCDAIDDGSVGLLGNKDHEEDSQNALPPPLDPTSSDASLVSAEVGTRSNEGGLETQVLNVRPDGSGKGSEKQGIEECVADGTQTDHTPPSAFGGFSVACLLTDVCQAGGAEGHTVGGPNPDSPGDIVALAAQALFSPPAVSAATSLPMQTHHSTDKRSLNTVTCQVDDHFPVISTTNVATCGADISSSVCTNPLVTFASCDVSWHVSGGISSTSVPPTTVPFIPPTPTSSACSQTLSDVCVKPLTSVSTAYPSTSSTIPTSSCAYTSFAFGAEIRGRTSNEGVFPTLRGFEGPAGNGIQGNQSLDKTGALPIHCPTLHQQAADSEGERHLPFLTQLRDIRGQPMRNLGTYSSRTTLAKRSYSGHSGNSSPSSGHPLPTSGKRRKHGRDGGPASSHSYDRHATPNFGLVEAAGVRQYYHGPHGDGCAPSGFPQKNLQVNPSSCLSSTSDVVHFAGHTTRPLAPSAPQNSVTSQNIMPPCPQQQPQHVQHQFPHSHHSNHLHHHHHHHLSGQSSHSAAPPFSFTSPEELGLLESGSASAGLDFPHYHGFTSGRHHGTAHFNDQTVPDVCFQNPCVPLRSSSYSAESLIAGGVTQRRGSREMTQNRVSHQLPPAYSDNYSPVNNPSALGTPRCLISETTKPVPEMVATMHPSIHHQHSQQSYSSAGSSVAYGPRLESETMGSCGFGRTTGQLGRHSHRATQHTRSEDLGSLAVSVPGSRNGSRDHRSASTAGGSGGLKTPENKARARAKSSRGAVQSTYGSSRCPSFLPDTSHFVQNFTFPFVAADGSTGGSMAASVAPAASTTNFSHQVHLTSSSGSVAPHHHHNPVAPPPPSLLTVDGPPPYFPAYPPPRPSADVPPLPIFSNQLFVSSSEKPPARGALGATFAPPLLSPPRPVAFPQPGFPPLLSDTPRSHAVPGGASATVSPCAPQPGPQTQPAPPLFPSFNLTSLFPEITVASNSGGESLVSVGMGGGGMTMPPPASHGGAEGGKQTGGTRGTHNISRILGHNGSSA